MRRITLAIALTIAFSSLLLSSIGMAQQAPAGTTTYIYAGNHFTYCWDSQEPKQRCTDKTWPYTIHSSVILMFTVSSPLPANMWPMQYVQPLSWMIDDGAQRMTAGSSKGVFLIGTDATGTPSYWQIDVRAAEWWGVAEIRTYMSPASGPIKDEGVQTGYTGAQYWGKNTFSAGRWIVITTP